MLHHTRPNRGSRGPACHRLALLLALGVLVSAHVVGAAGPAGAHAELTSSEPAEGATVTGPIAHVSLRFLNPVVAVADQVELLDASGTPVAIAEIDPVGETTLMHVIPEEPLTSGAYGLKWAARAGDSHPRVGTVTFIVEAAPAPAADEPVTAQGEAEPTETGGDKETSTNHPPGATANHAASMDLQAALASADTGNASSLAAISRFLIYAGLLIAVGGILYLALVHRGTRGEGRRLVFLVRRAAVLTLVGTVVELPFQAILIDGGSTDAIASPDAYTTLLDGSFGGGVLLRVVGAALVLVGMRMQLDRLGPDQQRVRADASATTPDTETFEGGGIATRVRPTEIQSHHSHRVRVESSPMALLGAAALIASEVFIGHTASSEPRWLVIASTVTHLIAASLWVAGVAMLALTLWRRHRHGAELEAALLATRFSVVAIGAVAAVSVTGLALGIAILGDVGAVVSTEFGQLLLLKIALVALLVALGGYNQRVIIPALERRRTARKAGHRLRWLVTAEVATFLAVIAVTAALVGADSTG